MYAHIADMNIKQKNGKIRKLLKQSCKITSVTVPSKISTWDELVQYQKYKKISFRLGDTTRARSRNIEIPKKYTYYAGGFIIDRNRLNEQYKGRSI